MPARTVNGQPIFFDGTLNKTVASIGGLDIATWALSVAKGDVIGLPYKVRAACGVFVILKGYDVLVSPSSLRAILIY